MQEIFKPHFYYLSEYSVFVIKLICTAQCKEKLAAIIMGSSVCHGNQSSSVETQPGMEFILQFKNRRYIYQVFQNEKSLVIKHIV